MNRTTKLLLAVFVLLAIVAYFTLPSGDERVASYKPAKLDLSIDSANVVRIEIQRPGKAITLENIGGKWTITSPGRYPADAPAVQQVIEGLRRFKVGSLVSSNPEKQGLYQVDTTGTRLTVVERSGKSLDMMFGKTGPSYTEIYFRLMDSKEVYLGEGLSSWVINRELKEWRDKTVFAVPVDSIKQIAYHYKKKTILLQRDGTRWSHGKDTVDTSVMSMALTTLSNLRAHDFVDTLFRPRTKPLSVKVHALGETSLDFYPQPPDSTNYFVQSSQNPQIYVVSRYVVQDLIKPIEKFVK